MQENTRQPWLKQLSHAAGCAGAQTEGGCGGLPTVQGCAHVSDGTSGGHMVVPFQKGSPLVDVCTGHLTANI